MKMNEVSFGSVAVAVRKQEVAKTSVLKKLDSVYDEHAKLVFIFDISGSMEQRVARGAAQTNQFLWTPELIAQIRKEAKEAGEQCEIAAANGMDPEPMFTQLLPLWNVMTGTLTDDDEELKTLVVKHDLIARFGLQIDWLNHNKGVPTRLELVRKLGKRECKARFTKYPKARIAVVAFASSAEVRFDDQDPDKLDGVMDNLQQGLGGGTDILNGINLALDTCRKNPSAVGIHHFVVVSDGDDHNCTRNIGAWVPALKASGVVLDYIHIGELENKNSGLEAACKELGGESVAVNTEDEFELKFVQAAQRPMLPPPAAVA